MLAYLSGAGLEFGFAVTTASSSDCAGAPAAMPADPDRGLSGTELIGLGVFLAVVVAVPLIAGLLLDRLTGTSPLFLLLGLLGGVAGAAAGLRAQLKRYL
ncbi:MAG: hypothetical protein ACLQT7_10180 [Candidatus Dormibacteria bacterium]